MPTFRNRLRVGERKTFHEQLFWDALRHHPGYRRAVADILRNWRRLRTDESWAAVPTPERRPTLEAALRDSPKHPLARSLGVRDALAAYRRLLAAARRRRNARLAGIGPHLTNATLTKLQGLEDFQATWQVLFPLTPRLAEPPMGFVTAPVAKPIRITEHSDDLLVMEFWARAGRPGLELLPGLLDHVNHHREIGGSSRRTSTRPRTDGSQAEVSAVLAGDNITLRVEHPEAVSAAAIRRVLTPLLKRPAVATKDSDEVIYPVMFRVIELSRRGLKGDEIAKLLRLDDTKGRGVDRVKIYRRMYLNLIKRLGLPTP